MKTRLVKSEIILNDKGKKINFFIIHNFPNTFGLSINNALQNWLVRTKTFTAESLCKYIMSKHTEYVAMTEEQYERISKYGK